MPSTLDLAGRLAGVVSAQQEVLHAISDLDRALQVVVDHSARLTGASGAAVELLVDDDELVFRSGSGVAKKHLGLHLPLDASLSGLAVRQREVMRCNDSETDPRVDHEACRMIGIRSMILAPIVDGEQVTGVLNTFSDRPNAFVDLDAYVVQLLAGMTSGALQQAGAFERYRLLFERNVAGVFRSTRDGRILDCNDALASYFGYASRAELMAQPTWDLYQERAERESLLASLDRDSALTNVRLHFKRKDGSPMTALMTVSILTAAGGDQLLGTIVETT
jgi:PAS domain S-box-containing protein